MSGIESPTDAARNVRKARERLFRTAHEIQARLTPAQLIHDATERVKERSAEIAKTASEKARERPTTVIGVVLAGIVLAAHRPLWRLGRTFVGRSQETESDDAS